MISIPRLARKGRVLLLLSTLSCASLSLAIAQQPGTFKPGEVLLYCQPGTPQNKVEELATKAGAEKIVPMLLADCYQLILPEDARTDVATTNAVAKLKGDGSIRSVSPMYYRYRLQSTVEPNDPRYKSGEMWNLKMVKMPQAWALTKGFPGANASVIDSAFNPSHEDLQGQYHSLSRDIADGDDDITADGSGAAESAHHGTHVSGTIIAKTNNGIGIAGICWENIKCIGVKIEKRGTDGLDGAAYLNALTYISSKVKEGNIKTLNLSLGGAGNPTDTNNPEYVAMKSIVDQGVLVIAAAGNSAADDSQTTPAAYPFVITVSAVRPNGTLTSYSSFGKVDLAAPGGELAEGNANGVLSTLNANAYIPLQGTSMAAPHVAGIATLVMSVPGVTATTAREALLATANRSNIAGSVPDTRYGYGVVDAAAALALVSVRVEVQDPIGTDPLGNTTDPTGIPRPVETLRPIIRFKVTNVPLASTGTSSLSVTIDGQTISTTEPLASVESGTTTGQNPSYTIALRLPVALAREGEHTIVIQGTNPSTGTVSRDERRFNITPHVIPAGTSMISIPFFESAADSTTGAFREIREVLGNDVSIFRWVYLPTQNVNGAVQGGGKYARIEPSGTDLPDNAKFRPSDTQTTPGDSTNEVISPVGLAYFIKAPASVPVITRGLDYSKKSVRIPLNEGWNMVGDPYNYAVSFNTVVIEERDGTRSTAQEAAEKGLILPYIYRFVGNEYQFQALPNGVLAPWEGHWIYVVPKNGTPNPSKTLTMIVQPVQGGTITRSASTAGTTTTSSLPRVSGSGSWSLRLEARTKGLVDTANYIGMTTRAASTRFGSVPKPPKMSPYVSLGITKADAPNGIGLYAQDLQATGGTKTWDVIVNTDQAESDVVVSWPEVRSVPRNVRLTLTDKATGQTVDLRQQSSFRFNTGRSVEPRALTITAKPSAIAGRALVTNLMVNPVRPANGRSTPIYEINYSLNQDVKVEMSILSASGKMMATVGNTRAAAVGDNRAVWNGRDNAGRDLPAGLYVLQVRAITGDGEITRSVTSFLMTR